MSNLAPLFNYLGDKVPIGTVAVLCLLVYLVIEMRYIKRDLSNHITDTNKKIDDLKKDMNDGFKDLKDDMRALFSKK